MSGKTWAAKYAGRCHLCGYSIRVDVQVTWDEGLVVHADCADLADEMPDLQSVHPCPRCWQMYARNGACGCGD